jgi:hypothetical protein
LCHLFVNKLFRSYASALGLIDFFDEKEVYDSVAPVEVF